MMCHYFLKSYITFEYLLIDFKLREIDLLYFCNLIKETPSLKKKKKIKQFAQPFFPYG